MYNRYEARTAYIRTTAVMSMVGYILGLGDRHGENILFDSKCGDCVHVDFNCLFNRVCKRFIHKLKPQYNLNTLHLFFVLISSKAKHD